MFQQVGQYLRGDRESGCPALGLCLFPSDTTQDQLQGAVAAHRAPVSPRNETAAKYTQMVGRRREELRWVANSATWRLVHGTGARSSALQNVRYR